MKDIKETLQERGINYGSMEDNARVTDELMRVCKRAPNFDQLESMHRECLHMILHKISRMLCGDVFYPDNMHDVAGYAKLLEEFQIHVTGRD